MDQDKEVSVSQRWYVRVTGAEYRLAKSSMFLLELARFGLERQNSDYAYTHV